jgi:hypothetical protein
MKREHGKPDSRQSRNCLGGREKKRKKDRQVRQDVRMRNRQCAADEEDVSLRPESRSDAGKAQTSEATGVFCFGDFAARREVDTGAIA